MASKINGMVKDTKGITYSAPEMVERHYMPHRANKRLVPDERVDIMTLAAAYKLDETGLAALADYMNSVSDKVKSVPPNADKVAREHAKVKLPKKNGSRTEPYVVEIPGYGTAPTQQNTFF
jgi:hypothetical protein